MAVSPRALCSLADLAAELKVPGPRLQQDEGNLKTGALLERCVDRASEEIERRCDRRIVYRGGQLDGTETVKAAANLADGALGGPFAAISGGGRTLRLTVTDPQYGLEAGKVVVSGQGHAAGIEVAAAAVEETFRLERGGANVAGVVVFTEVTGVQVSETAGVTAGRQKISIGTSRICRDFLSPREDRSEIHLTDYPVRQVLEVCEDLGRNFGEGSRILEDDDWVLDPDTGLLTRVSGSYPIEWDIGVKVGRVDYVGGFKDSVAKSGVPSDLRSKAAQLGAMIYRELARELQGVSSRSDSEGSTTRFFMAGVGTVISEALEPHVRHAYASPASRAYAAGSEEAA